MTRIARALAVWLVSAGTLGAQTPAPPGSRLGFDQQAPDLATAQGYDYAAYVDKGPRTVLAAATCQSSVPPGLFTCVANLPAMTPGDHAIELTAATTVSGVLVESLRSVPFAVRVVIAPAPPQSLRIVP